MLLMPSWGPDAAGVKLVTVQPDNPARSLALINGVYVLFSGDTLEPIACFEAAALTALRTAAVSAVATRHLAGPNADRLVVFGSGVQAEAHVRGWLDRYRLVEDPDDLERLRTSPFGEAVAWSYPDADSEVLELAADLLLWLVSFDDTQVEKLRARRSDTPHVTRVVVIDGPADDTAAGADDDWVVSLQRLQEIGAAVTALGGAADSFSLGSMKDGMTGSPRSHSCLVARLRSVRSSER